MITLNRDGRTASYDEESTAQFRYVVAEGLACEASDLPDQLWFRYDDGWRFLPDGERTTVDREWLLSEDDWLRFDEELGEGIRELLDALRAR